MSGKASVFERLGPEVKADDAEVQDKIKENVDMMSTTFNK